MNTSSVNLTVTIVSEFQFQIHKRVDIGQNEYDFWFDLRMTRTQSFGLEAESDHASKSQTRDTSEMEEAAIQSSK